MRFVRSRILAVALLPALPAQAVTPTITAKVNPTAQVLVAEGDGWSVYTDAASLQFVKVSQVFVDGEVTPQLVVDCGIVTCSAYFSRAQTRQAQMHIGAFGGGIGGLAGACTLISLLGGPAAPFIAVACGASILIYGGLMLDAINNAANANQCFRIRYGALPTAFFVDSSGFCHNT